MMMPFNKLFSKTSLTLITSFVINIIIPGIVVAAEPSEKNGRTLYIQKGCYSCHGYEGQGGIISGPKLAPEPLPVEVFIMRVRRPPVVMPAYSPKVLGDDELLKIYAFLQTIPSLDAN